MVQAHARIAERIAWFKKNPPDPDWDGVYQATDK